jgi:hypothetical protein
MRPGAVIVVLALLAPSLPAQRAANPDPKAMKARLEQDVKQAKEALLRSLNARAYLVKNNGALKADTKLDMLNQIEKEVSDFKDKNALPTSDESCGAVLRYLGAVHAARKPLAAYYTREIDRAIKANNLAQANSLSAEKATLDVLIGKIDRFTRGSNWHGSRIGRKASTGCSLHVKKVEGTSFEGELRLVNSNAAADRMVVAGKIDGNRITFQNGKMLQGAARKLTFDGYVIDGRILAGVGGIAVNKKPALPSIIDLRLGR